MIGIGGIGNLHTRFALQNENVKLTAIADVDEKSIAETSGKLGVSGFSDYRKMLDSGLVDAVSICTPHYLHYKMSMDALDAGVHVFVEKPAAINITDAEGIVRKAEDKKLRLCVGNQYRTFRTSRTLKNIIETGQIGNIMRVFWSWFEFRTENYYQRDGWRSSWYKAGGGISIHNIHDLDLICWMIGKPVQVNAFMGTQLHNIEVEDYYCANIIFENGAFCTIQVTINQPVIYNTRQIAGDKGIIIINNVKSLTFDHKDKILLGKYENTLTESVKKIGNTEEQPKVKWEKVKLVGDPAKWKKIIEHTGLIKQTKPHGLSVLMDSFVDAIMTGGEPIVTGKSTLMSLELYNAILLSAFRKKTVDLPLDRNEFNNFFEELTSRNYTLPIS